MTKEDIEKRLNDIFDKYKVKTGIVSSIAANGYCFPIPQMNKKILFVGINPSLRSDETAGERFSYIVPQVAVKDKIHFAKFLKLAQDVNLAEDWTCLDLFYFRDKNQRAIDALLSDNEGLNFICDQLELTFDIIKVIAPKVIVVLNKRARDFLGKNRIGEERNVWMGFRLQDNIESRWRIIHEVKSNFINSNNVDYSLSGTAIIFSRSLLYMPLVEKNSLISDIQNVLWQVTESQK